MKLKFALLLIVLAAFSRLLPHPPNFTPIAAMGLFGAAYFSQKWLAYLIPFAALFVSDLLLNNILYAQYYEGFVWMTSPFIYVAFAAVILFGASFLKKIKAKNVLFASLSASLIFFLITNFASWLEIPMYPKTFNGLIAAYTAGMPYFPNTILGDLVFSFVLFGAYEYVVNRKSVFA